MLMYGRWKHIIAFELFLYSPLANISLTLIHYLLIVALALYFAYYDG